MNDFTLSLLALLIAIGGQAAGAGLACELALRPQLRLGERLRWLAWFVGGTVLTLHHGYALELALRTGLYDLRQAILAALGGLLLGVGMPARPRQPEA